MNDLPQFITHLIIWCAAAAAALTLAFTVRRFKIERAILIPATVSDVDGGLQISVENVGIRAALGIVFRPCDRLRAHEMCHGLQAGRAHQFSLGVPAGPLDFELIYRDTHRKEPFVERWVARSGRGKIYFEKEVASLKLASVGNSSS